MRYARRWNGSAERQGSTSRRDATDPLVTRGFSSSEDAPKTGVRAEADWYASGVRKSRPLREMFQKFFRGLDQLVSHHRPGPMTSGMGWDVDFGHGFWERFRAAFGTSAPGGQ